MVKSNLQNAVSPADNVDSCGRRKFENPADNGYDVW